MGWPEKLPSGRYRGVYRDRHGKRRSAGTFPHKAAATRAANAAERDARLSGWRSPDRGRETWGDWCTRWWAMRERMVEPSTLRSDSYRLHKHLLPRWGDVELADITRGDIRAWAAELRTGHTAATVQRIVHLFSASLNAAMEAAAIPSNPAARLKLPSPEPADERYLTAADIDAIADNMPTERDKTILYLLAYSGMRWGEMAGLHWNRVDLKRGRIQVVETIDDRVREIKAYPKGKKIRYVPLPLFVLDRLENPGPGVCGLTHRGSACTSPLVVTSKKGVQLSSRNWRRVFDQAVDDAGLDKAHPHMTRHAYASWLIQGGKSLAEIGKVLGHKSVQTTARYTHLIEDQDDIVDALPAPRLQKVVHEIPDVGDDVTD